MRRTIDRLVGCAIVLTTLVAVALTGGASAVTPLTIGQAEPSAIVNCSRDVTAVQTGVESGTSYTVPAGNWNITSWSTYADMGSMGLIAFRPTATAGTYTVVGESRVQTLMAPGLSTFSLVPSTTDPPIAVTEGDLLGFWTSEGTRQCVNGFTGPSAQNVTQYLVGNEPAPGSQVTLPQTTKGVRLNISATLTAVVPPAPSVPDLVAASDDGVSSSDNVTSLTGLTLTGTAEPGSTVTLLRDGVAVGTARAAVSDGSWSIADSVPSFGVYSYTATATDAGGNVSPESGALVVTVVAAPSPDAIVALGPVVGSMTGGVWPIAESDSGQVVGTSGSYGTTQAFSWTAAGGLVYLSPVPGGSSSAAAAVNESGMVVGSSMVSGASHAVVWTRAGAVIDLGPGSASDVNNLGQVVGASTASGQHAFMWTQGGGMVDLGTLGGSSSAAAVSESSQVVGWSSLTPSGDIHAFSWTPGGAMIDLGTLGGETRAVAVNSHGQVVGFSYWRTTHDEHAFSWTPTGGMIDLGGLGGWDTSANAINDAGQIVGYSSTGTFPQEVRYAVMWTPDARLVDLGNLGGAGAVANAISQSGQVIGSSRTSSGNSHAFSWTQGAGMLDLGTLGGASSNGYAVNAAGQVAGYSSKLGGTDAYATVWQTSKIPPPVPRSSGGGGGVGSGGGGSSAPTTTTPVTPQPTPPSAAPLAPPPVVTVVVRPVISKAVTVPTKLVHGKAALVSFKVSRSDNGKRLTSRKMVCDPSVNGKVLRHAEQFRNGVASLRFTVPKTAQGKQLKVRLTIKLGSQSTTRISTFLVG
jgi:probable HAF family extracellular repeat protein